MWAWYDSPVKWQNVCEKKMSWNTYLFTITDLSLTRVCKLPSWLNRRCRFPTNLTIALLYFSSSNISLSLLHNKIHPATLFCQLNGFKCEDTAVGNVWFELKVTKSSDTIVTYTVIQIWGWYQCNNGGLRVAPLTWESFMCRWAFWTSRLQ